ncbi:MAG: hypothetical protein V2B19_06355 [Pseudomonadota bacterium]
MDNTKKITAAVSAVISYIQEEEAAVYMQSMMAAAAAPAMITPTPEELSVQPAPMRDPAAPTLIPLSLATSVSLWGASGRQSQMQLRNLMQLRAFNRI